MKRSVCLGLGLLIAISGQLAAATLGVGDPAPKLQVGKWVQGEPVKEFQKDKAYIVEFWATWCGPCRVSIPHLNEIHEKFKDKGLVVIGQDVWERDESQVEPFVKKMGEKMTYRVAMDDKSEIEQGAMAKNWMEAAGQNGIPAAFLVGKDGRIAWIGHPMELKDAAVEQVLAGTYDIEKAAADQRERQGKQEQLMKLSRQLGQNMQAKDWDKAEATLAEIAKVLPEEEQDNLNRVRLHILLSKGDDAGAAKMAEQVNATLKEPMQKNQLAWMMASSEGLKGESLKTAAKIAAQANQASGEKDPAILDTVARLAFMQGEKEKAVQLQEKAVGLAEGEMKDDLQKTLESYKEGKLPDAD